MQGIHRRLKDERVIQAIHYDGKTSINFVSIGFIIALFKFMQEQS